MGRFDGEKDSERKEPGTKRVLKRRSGRKRTRKERIREKKEQERFRFRDKEKEEGNSQRGKDPSKKGKSTKK